MKIKQLQEMPHSLEAECALLGSIMLRPRVFASICDIVMPGHFYRSAHRIIYETIASLFNRGNNAIDVVSITEDLMRLEKLDEVGGVEFLSELSEAVPTSGNAVTYANRIRDLGIARDLIERSWEALDDLYHIKPGDVISDIGMSIAGTFIQSSSISGISDIKQLGQGQGNPLDIAFEDLEELTKGTTKKYHPTGFSDLDRIIHGFSRSTLVTIGGDSSSGKTALAVSIGMNLAELNNDGVLVISLETEAENLAQRMLISRSMVNAEDILTAKEMNADTPIKKLREAKAKLQKLPIYIVDNSDMTAQNIKNKIMSALAKHNNIFAIVIDYIQIIQNESRMSREQQVAMIASSLKKIAKDHKVCVIALSQFNQKRSERNNPAPQRGDLRESQAIFHASDLCLLEWVPMFDLEALQRTDSDNNCMEVIVDKNKDGRRGKCRVFYNPAYFFFGNLESSKPTSVTYQKTLDLKKEQKIIHDDDDYPF